MRRCRDFDPFEPKASVLVLWRTKIDLEVAAMPRKSRLVNQFDKFRERRLLGIQGAASKVRSINLASVDTAALVERLGLEQDRWNRRVALRPKRS
jgi:hypothetical protein